MNPFEDDLVAKAYVMEQILNDITSRVHYGDEEYFILLKKQSKSSHCLFYLTDFGENFWMQKITYEFCEILKQNLQVKSTTKCFASHLAKGICQGLSISEIFPIPILKIKLKIGNGLIMNTQIKLSTKVSLSERPDAFKITLKVFGKQLYEAKQNCERKIRKEKAELTQQQKTKEIIASDELKIENAGSRPQSKTRDLINPFRKKRRGKGMKLRAHNSCDSNESDE